MSHGGHKHAHGSNHELAFGIDVGGSGIKGAPVNLITGEFEGERLRIPTPQPATPESVAAVVAEIVDSFDLKKSVPVGVTVPGIVQHGVVWSAANIDDSWIGADAAAMIGKTCGRHVHVANDADAAGYAEVVYGAAQNKPGVIMVITLGTGIGSALVCDGMLVPNTELGHLEIDGFDAESRAADSAREREDLSWEDWAVRLQRYFGVIEALFSPDLIVVGGGVSKKYDKFLPLLSLKAPIIPATLRNAAGIVGAAALAAGDGPGARE